MKKVLVFLAEGFEEIEAVTIVDLLRRADVNCKTMSITGKREVMGAHGVPFILMKKYVWRQSDWYYLEVCLVQSIYKIMRG